MEVSIRTPQITGIREPNVAIVTTSINAAPASYGAWTKMGTLIVAGDRNSPEALKHYVHDVCDGVYLSPEAQEFHLPGSEYVGWNTIQRRNAALWFALTATPRYDYIVTVDDDNIPNSHNDEWIMRHIVNLSHRPETTLGSKSGFLNTGAFCIPTFHQRGVPYGVDTKPYVDRIYTKDNERPTVVVSQAQVLGDPDCDAVERIANAPNIAAVNTEAVITPGCYAAFNTQATVWAGAYAPLMAVMPGIGRYDDIFGSFIFHRIAREYNLAMFVGTPCVKQDRNTHDLAKDLRAELFGMNTVFDFCRALDNAHISRDMPLVEAYGELITATAHILPSEAVKFAQAWTRAWRTEL